MLSVSTRVGGVPEILPDHMIKLAEPVAEDLVAKTLAAISELPKFDPWRAHEQVREMYSWYDVALRTENVYQQILKADTPTLLDRMRRFHVVGGAWAGKIWALMMAFGVLLVLFWEWMLPKEDIDIAPDFPYSKWVPSVPLPDHYFTASVNARNTLAEPNGGRAQARRGSAPAKTLLASQSPMRIPTIVQPENDDESEEEGATVSPSSSPSIEVKKTLKLVSPETSRVPYGSRRKSPRYK